MASLPHKSAAARLLNWRFILLFWFLFAVFITLPRMVTSYWTGQEFSFLRDLSGNLLCCLTWALATPIIVRLAQRFMIAGPRWLLHLLFHIAACTLNNSA